jgi:uncharacterized membrane protein
MEAVRTSMHDTANELSDRVNKVADLNEQVRTHPIAALVLAGVIGLVIGRQLSAILGLAALGASAVLRPAPPPASVSLISDRVVGSIGSALAGSVLTPVMFALQKAIDASSTVKEAAEQRGGRVNA